MMQTSQTPVLQTARKKRGSRLLWHEAVMAASIVVSLPIVVLFVLAQRYFVQSINLTSK
jgi:ABC-type glycerol-3-phosphate transport system permease component